MPKALLVLATIAVIVLAACSGDGASTASPTAAVTSPPLTTPAASPVATAAASPTPGDNAVPTATQAAADPSAAIAAARAALASWLGPVGDPASVSVASVEAVTWSNGCLDLVRAGRACTEALVDGFRIGLALGNATYEVRTDVLGLIVLWAPKTEILVRFAEAGPNAFRFTTDDGGTIDAQPVAGTDYGLNVASLSPGDPIGIAVADAPQSGGLLLVWLDPVE